jgi:hypothetical protein
VVRRDQGGGTILIEVPRGVPPGAHTLSARSEALVSEHSRPFVVLAVASIDRVSPDHARWGQQVRIDGVALGPSVRIWLGSVELPIVKRAPSGRQVWVVIPDSARGTSYVEIDDGGGQRERSAARLTIEESPDRGRDHRRHEPPGKPR